MALMGRRGSGRPEAGSTYIEIAIMALLISIMVVAVANAIRVAAGGAMLAKERSRALALAQDKLEEVKNMGYSALQTMFSNYLYPDQPDPANPLHQLSKVMPYPATPPIPTSEDHWTPEIILMGNINYWRHVVIKFVEEPSGGGELVQKPEPCSYCTPVIVGGTNPGSNLAFIEVDVTWFSRRSQSMEQVRVSTLLANTAVTTITVGKISGTIIDDDSNGDGVDGGATATPVTVLGSDDKAITWAILSVVARNIATNDYYMGQTNVAGQYQISDLPYGSYEVFLRGTPSYADSAYTGYTSAPAEYLPAVPITLSPGVYGKEDINIFSTKLKTVKITGRFKGVTGTAMSPKEVVISSSDGISDPVMLSVTWTCDAVTPCWFVLNDVAWPATGKVLYKVIVENKTDTKSVSASLCIDGTITASNFVVGTSPVPYAGANPCSAGAAAIVSSTTCVDPDWAYTPLDVAVVSTRARVRVKLLEYYNGTSVPLTLTKAGIRLLSLLDSTCATLGVDSTGATIFQESGSTGMVPPQTAGNIQFKAFVDGEGYTTDTYTLPFDVIPGAYYDLEEGSGGLPPSDQKHTFVLQRISAVSGTVWQVAGSKGYGGAVVTVKNNFTGWSAAVTADSQGHFYHGAVPVEAQSYKVVPVVGTDMVTSPSERQVLVSSNGVVYITDNSGNPMDFTLTAVNGYVAGVVYKGGTPVNTGAMVVASTYNGTFPTTLPSTTLSGYYSYSTVTMTDGSFKIKVATGLGDYYLYAFIYKDGALNSYGPSAAVAVTAGTVTTQDISVP